MMVSAPRAACAAPPASDKSAATTSACGSFPKTLREFAGRASYGAKRDAAAIEIHSHIPANRTGCPENRYFIHDCYNGLIMPESPNTRVAIAP